MSDLVRFSMASRESVEYEQHIKARAALKMWLLITYYCSYVKAARASHPTGAIVISLRQIA